MLAGVMLLSTVLSSKLSFSGDKFKILQLGDPQISSFVFDWCVDTTNEEKQWPCGAKNTTQFIERLLDAERPDLVVCTGDIIMSRFSPMPRHTIDQIFKPVIERQIPFAAVLGNHDEEGMLSRQSIIEYLSKMRGSVTSAGPALDASGLTGNYVIELSGDEGLVSTLWFFDSGDYDRTGVVGGYGWMYSAQINWYHDHSKRLELENGRLVPGIAFFHIPTPEWSSVTERIGDKNEDVTSSRVNSGVLTQMLSRGDISVVSVGHDHINDYCGVWHNLSLCYSGGVGYTTYGQAGWPRRARVFEIDRSGHVTTWKRLDDLSMTEKDRQTLTSV